MRAQDTVFYKKYTLDCGGKMLTLSDPAVMGILNITPDSFYDGGKYDEEKKLLEHARKMIEEGAAIIDVGAYSTRPGAGEISEEEELKRLIPAIQLIRKEFPEIIISADTFRSSVAIRAVSEGAGIINDISGGSLDLKMFETVATLQVPYVLMHMKGTPQTMQDNPIYENVTREVKNYFSEKIKTLGELGVKQIIIDPGFGFGKTMEHNYQLLKNMEEFHSFHLPLLAGFSRKSMINQLLHTQPTDALNGTTVLNTIALSKGANILRVHDVKEAKEAITITEFLKNIS